MKGCQRREPGERPVLSFLYRRLYDILNRRRCPSEDSAIPFLSDRPRDQEQQGVEQWFGRLIDAAPLLDPPLAEVVITNRHQRQQLQRPKQRQPYLPGEHASEEEVASRLTAA